MSLFWVGNPKQLNLTGSLTVWNRNFYELVSHGDQTMMNWLYCAFFSSHGYMVHWAQKSCSNFVLLAQVRRRINWLCSFHTEVFASGLCWGLGAHCVLFGVPCLICLLTAKGFFFFFFLTHVEIVSQCNDQCCTCRPFDCPAWQKHLMLWFSRTLYMWYMSNVAGW